MVAVPRHGYYLHGRGTETQLKLGENLNQLIPLLLAGVMTVLRAAVL